MKRTALVFFVFAAISSILYAQQQKNKDGMHEGEPIHNGFLKASQYLEFGKDNQSVYAMGLMDGMYMSPACSAKASNKVLLEIEMCVEGMHSTQVAAIIEKCEGPS